LRRCYCQPAEVNYQRKAPTHRVEDGWSRDSAGMGGMGPRPAGTGPRGDRKTSGMGGRASGGTRLPLTGTGLRGDEMVSPVARRGWRMGGCASTRCAGLPPRQSGMADGRGCASTRCVGLPPRQSRTRGGRTGGGRCAVAKGGVHRAVAGRGRMSARGCERNAARREMREGGSPGGGGLGPRVLFWALDGLFLSLVNSVRYQHRFFR
jgi:hypothetical protein